MNWRVRACPETCDSMPDKQQSKHVSVRILTYQDRNQQGHRTANACLKDRESPRQVATGVGTGETLSYRRKGQRQLHFNHTGSSRRGDKGEAGWLSQIPLKISYPLLSLLSSMVVVMVWGWDRKPPPQLHKTLGLFPQQGSMDWF